MARCPFALFEEITGPVGPFTGGPVKVVHHTTEGSSYAGAKSAYRANKSDPHFTVAGDEIFQHIDTSLAARSLKNRQGGVETNRDSAIQIEAVGFAGSPKDVATLRSVAKLCRWIESEHDVPQHWPNGRPRTAINGRDPGGHNRNAASWDNESGHFAHSQVPENDHWDPAYSAAELAIVTPDAVFDPHQELATSPRVRLTPESAFAPDSAAHDVVDAVVGRVLGGLEASAGAVLGGRPGRVTVKVTVAGISVEVMVDATTDTSQSILKPPAPPRRPASKTRRPSRRKLTDR